MRSALDRTIGMMSMLDAADKPLLSEANSGSRRLGDTPDPDGVV